MFEFKQYIVNTLISSDVKNILKFHKKNKISIIKPLYGNGGEVFKSLIIFLKQKNNKYYLKKIQISSDMSKIYQRY